jgi:O-antigen biosynthesis protein
LGVRPNPPGGVPRPKLSSFFLKTSNVIPIRRLSERTPGQYLIEIRITRKLARGTCLAEWGVIRPTDDISSVVPSGKFLSRGGDKFFLKAIRLRGASNSPAFEDKIALRKRLGELYAAHTNAVLMAADEAEALLGLVAQPGMYALLELRVRPESLFSRKALRKEIAFLRQRLASLRCHPAVIGYVFDCSVYSDELRCGGFEIARASLAGMVAAVRKLEPRKVVGVRHRIDSVGLVLADEDFLYAVMPPLAPGQLRSQVICLHNLAEARPLILEFGPTSSPQDELIACAFGLGAAGVVAETAGPKQPANEVIQGALSLKLLTASELLPFRALNGACPPKPAHTPKVAVVVCAYDAARTIRRCLESLRRLDYPNFEVIIVDDGSRDATAQIAAEFPEFRLIRQPNKGLSVARNVGRHAALGELVAYTDSDCVVDPHWLTFMVRAMVESELDGCGGPNYAPHEDGWLEGCVAASPGAPSHVLTSDDRAEHLAGCNMLFRKAALEHVGGFDPQFTAAGDDVDICWRLMAAGYVLGYCPSAFVWHFRRNTVKAYYRQQRGYGKAEAMLYFKYPEYFNALGQIKWHGTIPGIARTMPGGGRLRVQWVRTTDQFQRVHETPLSVLAVAPMTAEWSVMAAALVVFSMLLGLSIWPAVALFAAGPLWAAHYALKAPLEKCHRGPASTLLIGWLAYTGSIMRAMSRYRWRANLRRAALFDHPARQRPTIDWKHRSLRLSYWNGAYTTRELLLEHIRRFFASLGRPVVADNGWRDFDLLVEANAWARIQFRTAEEELGRHELKTNVAARLRLTSSVRLGLAACMIAMAITPFLGSPLIVAAVCIVAAGATIGAISGLAESASLAYHAIEECARELELVPLGKLVPQTVIPAPIAPAAKPEGSAEAAQAAGR